MTLKILEMTVEEIISELADGDDGAEIILRGMYGLFRQEFCNLALDLDDMHIYGPAIVAAYDCAKNDGRQFLSLCTSRDLEMIQELAKEFPGYEIRQHGPQKTIKRVDTAVRQMIDEAQAENRLTRLDENSGAVHAAFLAMLEEMQKRKYFQSNFYLNLGNGVYAHFDIRCVGLVDDNRNPLGDPKADPTKENQIIAEELKAKAMTIPAQTTEPAIEEAISAAVDEFIEKQQGEEITAENEASGVDVDIDSLSYLLNAHDLALKKIVDPQFPRYRMAHHRWAFLVTSTEIEGIVNELIKSGSPIDDEMAAKLKAGEAPLNLNNVFLMPELEERASAAPPQPLNG